MIDKDQKLGNSEHENLCYRRMWELLNVKEISITASLQKKFAVTFC
jgi:hypothetical protein